MWPALVAITGRAEEKSQALWRGQVGPRWRELGPRVVGQAREAQRVAEEMPRDPKECTKWTLTQRPRNYKRKTFIANHEEGLVSGG